MMRLWLFPLTVFAMLSVRTVGMASAQELVVANASSVLARQSWLSALEYEGRMCVADKNRNPRAKLFWAMYLGKSLHDYTSVTGKMPRLPRCEEAAALLSYEK